MKKILVGLYALFFTVLIQAQCPMCKASVESSQGTNGKSVGMGLNMGILMLLVSVYIIIMIVGIIWYRNYRKTQYNHG